MIDTIIKFENVKFSNNFEFVHSDELQSIYTNMKRSINKYHNAKHEICFYLYQLKELFDKFEPCIRISCNYGRTGGLSGLYSFESFCETFFNFDRSTIQRYIRVYEKFLNNVYPQSIQAVLKEFDISKLVELLSLDKNVVRDAITSGKLKSNMSVKDIRQFVKDICATSHTIVEKTIDIDEELIPDAYDPTIRYPKDYFIKLTTAQLQNCIFTLQDYCEKLREQLKDIKKKSSKS